MSNRPFAENLPYWKTSNLGLDNSLNRIVKEIKGANGKITGKAVVETEHEAFIFIEFCFQADRFKINWQALPSKKGDRKAALIQAAAMVYHDVKAKLVSARVKGYRKAFLEYLVLPDGYVVSDLAAHLPMMLLSPSQGNTVND